MNNSPPSSPLPLPTPMSPPTGPKTWLDWLKTEMPISGFQFGAFRLVFGLYLALVFATSADLGRWIVQEHLHAAGAADAVTSQAGATLLPNLLHVLPQPWMGAAVAFGFAALALVFASGWWRRPVALVLWYGWACFFNRNELSHASWMPYIGLLLLLTILLPPGEALVPGRRLAPDYKFRYYAGVYVVAWLCMALAFAISVLAKVSAADQLWVRGEGVSHMLEMRNVYGGLLSRVLLSAPEPVLRGLTRALLVIHFLVLPLSLARRSRYVVWLMLWLLVVPCLLLIGSSRAFPDFGLGLVMVLFFLFDPRWIPARSPGEPKVVVFYDGVCGLCNSWIQVLASEDQREFLHYSPLQGKAAAALQTRHALPEDLDSFIYVRGFETDSEQVYIRSDATFQVMYDLGGFWRFLALVRFVPKALRDVVYDFVAARRYQWFGEYDTIKQPPDSIRQRFLA